MPENETLAPITAEDQEKMLSTLRSQVPTLPAEIKNVGEALGWLSVEALKKVPPAEGVIAVENTNLKAEIERLKTGNGDLAKKLEEATSAVTLRAEKVKEQNDTITALNETISKLEADLDQAKGGTLAASDLTVEAILNAAYDKLIKLNTNLPCPENENAIRKIDEARQWLNRRTSLREAQKVEGTMRPHRSSI